MKKSVKWAILIPIILVLVIGIIVEIVVINLQSTKTVTELSDKMITETVNHYTYSFKAIGENSYGTAKAIAPVIRGFSGGVGTREQAVEVLSKAVLSNDAILDMWTCWEPNAFDGKDSEYIGKPYHDQTGRFIPCVIKNGTTTVTESLLDYTDPVAGSYYQDALKSGKITITDPFVYPLNGKDYTVYSIAIPIKDNNGKVIGVMGADVDIAAAGEKIATTKILGDGYMFILSPNGLVASHYNKDVLLKNYSEFWANQFGKELKELFTKEGAITKKAYSTQLNMDVTFVAQSVKIGDSEQLWTICSVIPQKTVNAPVRSIANIVIVIGVLLIFIVGTTIFIIIQRKMKPLKEIEAAAREITEGRLSAVIKHQSKDEFGSLAESMRKAMAMLKTYVDDIAYAMGEFADNNFVLKPPTIPFEGDFEPIVTSVLKVAGNMSETISQIRIAADQVSSGSDQVSSGAQALAQGATEQASSVEQLAASITEISHQVKLNAEHSLKANSMAAEAVTTIDESNTQMQRLMSAMKDIDAKSAEISKIIKTIEDIAFQTNILALNAAVEAARAGSAGKGFAVVADEVRNLAGKSAEAAKNTTTLIESSVTSIAQGVKLAANTAKDLLGAVESVKNTTSVIAEITKASNEQAAFIGQVTLGVDQISSVVQTNSATSEQSAAASEELSSQANLLKELVSKFKLKQLSILPETK